MSRLLKITDNGNGILVQGTDNILYPDNATLTFPYNSIILVTDESDIATFRSASNNDVLFSGLIGKIEIGSTTVTKANIIDKFDEIANQESGGGEPFDPTNYYTKSQTNALLDEKADESDIPTDVSELNNDVGYITDSALEDYFDGAEYDSNTRRINFKNGNTIKAYIDANAFIKDGMVENVEISNGNLVITFNTDAGKQPISIPLTDIFNPNNYYTKTDADGLFATQVVVNQEIAARIAGDNALNTALGAKADKSDTYTKEQTDQAIDDALANIDLSDYVDIDTYNKKETAIVNALTDLNENKADKATTYTKTQVDQAIDDALADISSDLSDLEENKQDKLTAGTNISIDANNVISASGAAAQIQSDWNQTDSSSVDYIKNKPTIPTVPTNVSAFTNDAGYLTQHQSLANYYTKTETDNTFVDKETFDTKEEVISTALNVLNENKADKATTYTKAEVDAEIETLEDAIENGQETTSQALNDLSTTISNVESVTSQSLNNLNSIKQDKLTAGSNITIENNVISATAPSLTNYYTKTETDNTFVDKSTFDTKEEVISTALNELDANKQDVLTAGANITIQNNVISATGGGAAQVQSDWNQTNTSAVDYIKNKPVIPDTSDFVTITQYNQKETAIANALTELNEDKADKTDLADYMTVSAFDIKEEVISSALNNLDERIGNINTILESI